MMQLQPRPSVFRTADIHPALRNVAEECRAIFVRLLAYLSGAAALAVITADLFDVTPRPVAAATPAAIGAWISASRPHPAFAVSKLDSIDITETYQIQRHPDGGRKDTLRWAPAGGAPTAEIEIYRQGDEWRAARGVAADLLMRAGLGAAGRAEAAGVIDSKFGPISILQLSNGTSASCVGFARSFDLPHLRISGWSCQPGTLSSQRAAIGCTLNRLMLLSAGNDPKLAELFAHAELRRTNCTPGQIAGGDWITEWREVGLRGRLAN